MQALNWLDWFFIIVVFGFGILGFVQGFVKGLISLLTWLIAAVLAYFLADTLDVKLISQWFQSSETAFWISFFSIIITVLIIRFIIHFFLGFLRKNTKSVTDRFLGLVFGIVKSALVLSLAIGVLSYNARATEQDAWQDSLFIPFLVKGAVWVDHKLPQDVHQKIHDNSIYNNSDDASDEPNYGKSKAELSAIG